MSDQQYLYTSRLGNIIRLIILGRQTGSLRAYRGTENSREEGGADFIEGQAENVFVGQIHDSRMLDVLIAWGECHYLFLDNLASGDGMQNSGGYRSVPRETQKSGSLPPISSGSLPGSQVYNPYPPINNTGNPQGYNQYDNQSYLPDSGYNTGYGPDHTPNVYNIQIPGYVWQKVQNSSYIPRRVSAQDLSIFSQFNRYDRQLAFLVDGRRTLPDLIRMTNRSAEEVQKIIATLIVLGLVE